MGDFPDDERLEVRPATSDDLEDIATVAQEGFPDDPEFNYRFPYRDKHPEDNRKWILQEYREYLEQTDKYSVIIVTASDNDKKAIALSVWDISISTAHRGSDLGIPDDPTENCRREDANPARFRKFKERMSEAFEKYFGKYGTDQIHLWLLATRPAFRRRGAGTRLCRWGLEQASQKSVYATVLASPMGKCLYEELNFDNCGSFSIQVDGEGDKLQLWAMTHSKSAVQVEVAVKQEQSSNLFLRLLASIPFLGQK
ncbi:acyl-CoA N-acyltransferase [Rostrohypoxylon terebratum]|nr:acyl-CoA N-acyltransferase [Rostrohypoxylon terebratum]